jgi:cardiolipin synthase A/B
MRSATVTQPREKTGRKVSTRLLVQPTDGTEPLIKAITSAKTSIQIMIFRFDQKEIEQALAAAVTRGVTVHALIASKNRAGEENLRALEQRLLGAGVTVARTGDDLVRYHSKYMIVDGRELYLLAFNLTHVDMEHSRSFGVVTTNRDAIREAQTLFECDSKRLPYDAGNAKLIVSPLNARKELARFIEGAKKELLIYDPQVSDRRMIRLLEDRAKTGVKIRILGRLLGSIAGTQTHKLAQMRLHTRTIVRDGQAAFVGSQSLREMELDARRELGIIINEPKFVGDLLRTFEDDWALADRSAKDKPQDDDPGAKIAKKVAKAVAREIPEVGPIVTGAVQEVVGELADVDIIPEEVEEMVKGAVKEAVKAVVRSAVEEAVEKSAGDV